jgi:cyclophilin family peptidyl-prolyl cis-trans isomerase
LPRQQRRRRRGPAQYQGPRKARPPFPINLLFNVKAFYLFFIVVMIASLAAVGLGTGLGSNNSQPLPIVNENSTPEPSRNPFVFDAPAPTIDGTQPHQAVLRTNKGDIVIDLATDAPAAVNSFAFLAGKRFYNGMTFFFVNHSFVAQAGDPTCRTDSKTTCSGVGGPGYSLPVQGLERHEQWAVVAPTLAEGGPEVHGSQFRILFQPDPRLDGKETVFGKVVQGQQILESLPDYEPCSIVSSPTCQTDTSSALVIQDVIVKPA